MSFESRLRSLLKTPELADPEAARRLDTIQIVLLPLLTAPILFAVLSLLLLPGGSLPALVSLGAAIPLVVCLILARAGWTRTAATAIVFALWLIATLDLYLGGGVSAPGQSVYLVAILMAAFVVSLRSALVFTLLSLLATGVIASLEATGRLPESVIVRDPMSYWMAQFIAFFSASGLVWVALRQIQYAIEAARHSENRHVLVAENTNDFVWSIDADHCFTYASPAVERILGFTPEEIMGTRAIQDQLSADSPLVGAMLVEAAAEGRDSVRCEAQQRRKDGTFVWCEFNIRVMRDAQGRLIGLTGVTRDISERKRAEKEREELEDRFRQSQKMEAVGTLAGGIAHDFNNYLTVILGNTEILKSETNAQKGSRLLEIENAALRSAELTQQLLAFSRKQVLQPVLLDLNRTLRDADPLLRRVLGEDISIETICAGGLGPVEADPNQLELIILNLAVNARAAMPEGGKLTLETGNIYLDAEYAERKLDVEPGRYVMLAVSDSGVGMDEATRLRIFEPFFTTREGGSGLGLSTVHGIVKQSGGTIEVYSEPGEGTTFRIYLPRVEAAVDASIDRVESALTAEMRGNETILVVEDEPMVQRLVREILETRGFRVLTAGDRNEAVAIAEREAASIDLLLTDVVLPGTNGVELARELHERIGLRVVYMSGFTENGIVHRGILEPHNLLLQKPFSAKQLLQLIRNALDA